MAGEIRYYVLDGQQKSGVEILHFDRLYLAIRAYRTLPATSQKVLGAEAEGRSADLARCVPVSPGDEEGEDVVALDFLRAGFGDARPKLIRAAQDLAECLRVRYCLYRGCLLQVPTKNVLPKGLRGRYLWPAEPGKFETAIQWIKVVGVGSLSPAEFKHRFRSDEGGASTYPLVLRLNVQSRTEDGRFCSLDVTPWEFMLLERCTRARQALRGGDRCG